MSKVLTTATMPKTPGAYIDNARRIWLFEPDMPSQTGKWRIPGGVLAKPGSIVLDKALEKLGVTELRRMLPRRRPE